MSKKFFKVKTKANVPFHFKKYYLRKKNERKNLIKPKSRSKAPKNKTKDLENEVKLQIFSFKIFIRCNYS